MGAVAAGLAGLVAVALILVVAFTGGGRVSPGSKTLRVVATENFWGNIAAQIAGGRVSVTSIITDPGRDPHQYESDARAAGAIASADVVVVNGLGYDDFVEKLMSAAPNGKRKVVSAAAALGVTGRDANPHLWYDLPRVPTVAAAIEQALAAKRPADGAVFAGNLQEFVQALRPLTGVLDEIRAKYPRAPVAYTERVAGYLLANAGLDVRTPSGFARAIEDGNEPSPADTAAMSELITGRRVRLLLYNSQATSRVTQHVQNLARQAGIPVVGVTETLPPNQPDYESWQLHQLRSILAALGS